VLDLDPVPDARPFISSVYESRSNRTAVVFAVATKINHIEKALVGHAHFGIAPAGPAPGGKKNAAFGLRPDVGGSRGVTSAKRQTFLYV
jgi:hypothetical protein